MRKRFFIVLGDLTTHGGLVTSGDSGTTIDGIPVARFGDHGFCPQCKRPFSIVESLSDVDSHERGMVVEGMHVSCGATLIAGRQTSTFYVDAGRASAVTGFTTDLPSQQVTRFNDRYVLCDQNTGEPLANVEYAVVRENGETEFGITNAAGKTHLLSQTAKKENITVYVEG